MPTTATYTVNNPAAGTEYTAPSAYWVIPNASTQVKCTAQAFDSNGNLLQVNTLTAYVYDNTASVNKASFGGNFNTANASTSNPNGTDVYSAGAKVSVGGVAAIKMYLTYTGSAYDQPPNTPSNLSPAAGATVGLTPTFQGSFSDPTPGDTLYQYEIVVNNAASGGGSQQWDSGIVNASTPEINNAQFSKVYSGSALTNGHTYSWKARVGNQNGNWSGYSAWQNFTTTQGPNAPSGVTPTGQQTSTTPAWGFTYTSPSSVNQQSYHYTITGSGGALIYDSGTVADNVASGTTVTGTIPGGANLQPGQSYNFNVFCTDTNSATGATTSVAFSIAPLPQVTPFSPVNGATVNTQTPTFAWTYNDPNYTQATYRVVVQNAQTSASIWDSGVISSAASSVVSGVSITYGTNIRWQVIVTDTAGLSSGFSAWAYALVQNTPSAAITSPANNSTITSATPTIQWTYTASSGGQPQASAQVKLYDSNSNLLQTYNVSGAGTTFTLPAGVLINDFTYKVAVTVTDTVSSSGTSSLITFTLQYTPPADMQGQSLASGKNYVISPYMNSDVNSDGVADNFTSFATGGLTAAFSLDSSIPQPQANPNGDGPFYGAQKMALTAGVTAGGQVVEVYQDIIVATAGWTPNSTHISAAVSAWLTVLTGTPQVKITIEFYNNTTLLSSVDGTLQGDTAGAWVRLLGPQNQLIPTNTTKVRFHCKIVTGASGDTATAWFCEPQAEAAASSDPNFIGGSNGTGFSYDGNNYSVRTSLAGNSPTIIANPGTDTDPLGSQGGTMTITWDTTLADATRFLYYIIERRRQDLSSDDTQWVLLANITNKAVGSYTDYTPGGSTVYQYSVRQLIVYSDGATGYSANRAIVTGSVVFSPAWYMTNASGTIYNWRLTTVGPQRKFQWKEKAQYSDFLGRIGTARDAGPDAGYDLQLEAWFIDSNGDDRVAIRRQLVQMQKLNVIWYLRSPRGMVVPVHLDGFDFDDEDVGGDGVMLVTLDLMQAADSTDY